MNKPVHQKIEIIKKYYVWIQFIYLIFILTNFMRSMDVNVTYRFSIWDSLLTYGTIIFISFLESLVISLLLFALYLAIYYLFRLDSQYVIRRFLILGFFVSWVNLFLTVVSKPLF
jgi:hypothetical protein